MKKMQYNSIKGAYVGVTSTGRTIVVDGDEWAECEQADPPVPQDMLEAPDMWANLVGDNDRVYYTD